MEQAEESTSKAVTGVRLITPHAPPTAFCRLLEEDFGTVSWRICAQDDIVGLVDAIYEGLSACALVVIANAPAHGDSRFAFTAIQLMNAEILRQEAPAQRESGFLLAGKNGLPLCAIYANEEEACSTYSLLRPEIRRILQKASKKQQP